MITTTLGAAAGAFDALMRISQAPWPHAHQQEAYHVAKLMRLLKLEVEHYREARAAKIREWGAERATTDQERAATGQTRTVEVLPERADEFHLFMRELGAVAVMIDWAPLRLEELVVDVTSLDLFLLEEAGVLEPPVAVTTAARTA